MVTHSEEDLSDRSVISFRLTVKECIKFSDPIRDWRNCDWDILTLRLGNDFNTNGWLNADWDAVSTSENLDTLVLDFEDVTRRSVDGLIPARRKSSTRKHWWNPDLTLSHKDLKKKQRRLL